MEPLKPISFHRKIVAFARRRWRRKMATGIFPVGSLQPGADGWTEQRTDWHKFPSSFYITLPTLLCSSAPLRLCFSASLLSLSSPHHSILMQLRQIIWHSLRPIRKFDIKSNDENWKGKKKWFWTTLNWTICRWIVFLPSFPFFPNQFAIKNVWSIQLYLVDLTVDNE